MGSHEIFTFKHICHNPMLTSVIFVTVESYELFWRTRRLCDCQVAKVEHFYDFGSKPCSPILVRNNCIWIDCTGSFMSLWQTLRLCFALLTYLQRFFNNQVWLWSCVQVNHFQVWIWKMSRIKRDRVYQWFFFLHFIFIKSIQANQYFFKKINTSKKTTTP